MAHSHYGYIFRPTEKDLEANAPAFGGSVERIGKLRFAAGEWVEYRLQTTQLLSHFDLPERLKLGPPFAYKLIARQRTEFTLIAAETRSIIDYATRCLWSQIGLRHAEINVNSLVRAILRDEFVMQEGTGARLPPCISFLYAETTGYAPAVETVSFQGADLANALMVIAHKTKIVFKRCGLRIASERFERARFSVNGSVDFHQNSLHEGATTLGGTHIEELILDLIAAKHISL